MYFVQLFKFAALEHLLPNESTVLANGTQGTDVALLQTFGNIRLHHRIGYLFIIICTSSNPSETFRFALWNLLYMQHVFA